MGPELSERVARLEEWRNGLEKLRHEERIKAVEAVQMKFAGKAAVLAVLGATIGSAILPLVLRKLGLGG